MRSRVRVFVVVGLLVTAIDFVVFFLLESSLGIAIANLVALASAAAVSYLVNSSLTFKSRTLTRWVSNPWAFIFTALVAASVDTLTLFSVHWLTDYILPAKVLGIALAALVRWTAYRTFLFRIVRRNISTKRDRTQAPGDYRFSVVLPAYNEATRIGESIQTLRHVLEARGVESLEILVVDDASSDNTAEVAEQHGARVIVQQENTGKGGAVRTGLLEAQGKTILFTDSDLAYPPELVPGFLDAIEQGWDMAVGNRRLSESSAEIPTTLVRKLGGWFVNKLTHVVLLGQFRDTQCGIKAFRSDVAKSMASRLQTSSFGFDVELFIMAEMDRISLTELPVRVRNRPGSSVSLVRDTFRLIRDLIEIRRAAGRGAYAKASVAEASEAVV